MRQVKAWDAAAPATVTEEAPLPLAKAREGGDRGAKSPASQAGRPANMTAWADGVIRNHQASRVMPCCLLASFPRLARKGLAWRLFFTFV